VFVNRIALDNYRCFQGVELQPSRTLNVIVGTNNSGKSTLLRTLTALQFGASFGIDDKRVNNLDGMFEIGVEGPALPPVPPGVQPCTFRMQANGSPMLMSPNGNHAVGNPPFANSFPHNFACVFLSKRKVGGLNDALVAKPHSDLISASIENLVPKLDLLLTEGNPLRERLLSICVQMFGMRIAVAPSASGRSAGLFIDSDRQIPISAMGDGVAQMLALVADLLRAENKVFVVEELENDLHPRATRALLDLVIESCRSRGNQFFVSTHSNVVLRHLAAESDVKIFRTSLSLGDDRIPNAEVNEVPNTPGARRELLEELGYELFDAGLYEGYLLMEESSAETVVNEYLIPTFAPSLSRRLRTMAAKGFNEAEARFQDFVRLFTFLHLEPTYRDKAWVVFDAGEREREALDRLEAAFVGPNKWSKKTFRQWSAHDFERFYPNQFASEIERVLSIAGKKEKDQAKKDLRAQVMQWVRDEPITAKSEFEKSAREVIDLLREIEAKLGSAKPV
jgi:AAA domain, putative AbiEii toxin, Type IV TA system/AAA ATPase domain